MTSPAITKSPDNQKGTKSPSHSAEAERPASRAESTSASASAAPPQSEPFSWLRIFKLADLMMKQGC